MRRASSKINSVILGRRSYRERMARLLLQNILQTVDAELSAFANALVNQSQLDPHDLFDCVQQIGNTKNWRTVCDRLSLRLSRQLSAYFKRPTPSVVVRQPTFSVDAASMVSSLYSEGCTTRSVSILAEHLLSNVWGSFHVPGITAIGNEMLSELVNAGSKMLGQFDLDPQQLRAGQTLELRNALVGMLITGMLQVRSDIALTLYLVIRDLNRTTYLDKYDRSMRCAAGKSQAAMRVAAD
jgi:hypothetical protein